MKSRVVLAQMESAKSQTVFFPTRFAQAVADICSTEKHPQENVSKEESTE